MVLQGYRLSSEALTAHGLRATPVISAEAEGLPAITVAILRFWQRFPKAVDVGRTIAIGLLPNQFPDVHELQPGEQITEQFVMTIGGDAIGELPLGWVHAPSRVSASPDWYCQAGAVSYLTTEATDPNREYVALVNRALDPERGFKARREVIDEYGWRNFGDLYADHEAVFHHGAKPLISHYNNQYDAIAGFAVHFFRSGDARWLELLCDLARHVVDIDVYHTREDKSAYSGGLFWHTNHHVDAGTSTHRTYPRQAKGSGGPSAEHNYSTGLLLHYFLTGDPGARTAAIELADWVIAMDDGSRTPLRWVSRAPTGLASATGTMSYHGPGRGPGNSIVVLINAWRLTRSRIYLEKADELIRRCAHPCEDLDALNLLDAERRWYYTVFLQSLSRYLDCKADLGELDDSYGYSRATLLHYARWMERHERPYLDEPERLEFPNETWVAQEMRKAEVLGLAGTFASDSDERSRFHARARFFFEYVMSTLPSMETAAFTRPLVLLLTNGYSHAYFLSHSSELPCAQGPDTFPERVAFVSQRQAAVRRVTVAGACTGVLLLLALVFWLAR